MSEATGAVPTKSRIQSLDQYRGYAIFGMLLVNFFGFYKTTWVNADSSLKGALEFVFGQQLHHHGEYMTYADTIAPIFMFVVGIGMRLSWTNRIKHVEPGVARKAMAKRYFTLVLIAFAIYAGWLWDALMSIGLSGLVALIIVDKKWPVRVAYALGLVVAYQLIFSNTSYGEWLLRMGQYGRELDWPFITTFLPLRGELLDVRINGGLIGHWGWAFMLIMGTIAYDIMQTQDRKKIITGLLAMGIILTIVGWSAKCIGTQHFYKTAEPFVAAAIMSDDAAMMKDANQLVGKSPGILSSHFKGNEEALTALDGRNWAKLKEVGGDTLTALAVNAPAEAPRLGNEWVFSKNYVTMPFVFWASALCVFHLLAFFIVVDILGINVPGMKVIGMNPLAIYIFQSLALESFGNFMDYSETEAARGWLPGFIMNTFEAGKSMEHTTSAFVVFGSFILFFGFIYAVALYWYKKGIIIKI